MRNSLTILIAGTCVVLLFSIGYGHAKGIKAGYFDFQKLMKNSKKAKAQHEKWQSFVKQQSSALHAKKKAFLDLQASARESWSKLDDDARMLKKKELKMKELDLQLSDEKAKAAAQKRIREIQQSMYKDIRSILKRIRVDGAYTFIIKAEACWAADQALDITDEVVRRYDTLPVGNRSAGPPPAAPKKRVAPRKAPQ
jgi:Skp family chaperone for outer membrane proteins